MNNNKLHKNQVALLLFIFSAIPIIIWLVYMDSKPDSWDWGQWTVKPSLKVPVAKLTSEVPLCEEAIFEAKNGPFYHNLVTASIYLKSASDNHKSLNKKTLSHSGEINSIIREVVSSAKPKQIEDPKLKYVKDELSRKVGKIVGNDQFSDILIPKWEVDYPPFSTPSIVPR